MKTTFGKKYVWIKKYFKDKSTKTKRSMEVKKGSSITLIIFGKTASGVKQTLANNFLESRHVKVLVLR